MHVFRKSQELRAKLDALGKSQAIIEFNLDGSIITANPNFLNAMGYQLDEIQGKHHSMFVDPEYRDGAEYRSFWEALRRGEYQSREFPRIAKGGRQIWIQASYNPLMDRGGKPFKIVKFATDITAQKLTNADYEGQITAIRKSQAVIEFNLDGTVITANENFLKTLGYSLDEIQGKHHSMFVEPDYRHSAEYRAFWDGLRRGEYQAAEYKRVAKGGRPVWIQASYNPIRGADGKFMKVVKFATDTTAQAEDRIRRGELQKTIDIDLGQITDAVTATSERVSSAAGASTQTSSNMQAVASGAEELAASVSEISRQASDALTISTQAVQQANETSTIVSGLAIAAQKIGDVVKLINNIAEQTNLLALNATIEAARAGEAGDLEPAGVRAAIRQRRHGHRGHHADNLPHQRNFGGDRGLGRGAGVGDAKHLVQYAGGGQGRGGHRRQHERHRRGDAVRRRLDPQGAGSLAGAGLMDFEKISCPGRGAACNAAPQIRGRPKHQSS